MSFSIPHANCCKSITDSWLVFSSINACTRNAKSLKALFRGWGGGSDHHSKRTIITEMKQTRHVCSEA